MIPQIIHFCWFGKSKKPKTVKLCLATWKQHFPNFQIIEWNEKNTDLTLPFVRQAYKLKKWAFVSDFVRLKALYDSGGIYLDTDMFVLKSFDELLKNKCFYGAEDLNFISCGIIGTEKNHFFIKKIMEFYLNFQFSKEVNLGMNTIPRITTKIFRDHFNYNENFFKIVNYNDIIIYPSEFFYAFPYNEIDNIINFKDYVKPESYAVHLWNSSWVEHSEFYYLRKRKYIMGFKIIIKNIFYNKNFDQFYFKKILLSIKESLIKGNKY